ncbi:MAG: hypothetical protein IPI61_13105, partial [Syntrophaceae bacterium]|nr:hypothetical protein [Syntrophaceae bacterium]
PLFMAGDKYFFRQSNIVKRPGGHPAGSVVRQTAGEHRLQRPASAGVPGLRQSRHRNYLSNTRKVRLAAYYAKEFLANPSYVNGSLADTALAFFSYYLEPRHDFFFIFDYIRWEEHEVERVLLNEHDWELAPDTKAAGASATGQPRSTTTST